MSFLPEAVTANMDRSEGIEQIELPPSRTYYLDFAGGTIQGAIDGEAAIRQAIHKALITNMARPCIYDGSYGSELDALIGSDHSIAYLQSEVPRMITDALIYDDRIEAVEGVTMAVSGDVLYVRFTVVLDDKTELQIAEVMRR